MPPESGGICVNLTKDLPLGYLQSGLQVRRDGRGGSRRQRRPALPDAVLADAPAMARHVLVPAAPLPRARPQVRNPSP